MPDAIDPERREYHADTEELSPLVKAYVDHQIQYAIRQYEESQTKIKRFRNSWRSASPITKVGIYLSGFAAAATIVLAIFAWRQLDAMETIASSNTQQTDKLIEAANQMRAAGWTFSGASIGTNNAVWGAVGKLQLQVDQVKRSADAAKSSAETAKATLLTQRAVVYLGGPHFNSEAKTISFPIINSGRINSGAAEITTYEFAWINSGVGGSAEGHWRQFTYPSVPVGDGTQLPEVDPGEVFFDLSAITEGRAGYTIGFEMSYDDGFSNRMTWSTALCSNLRPNTHTLSLGVCTDANALADLKKKTKYPDPTTKR